MNSKSKEFDIPLIHKREEPRAIVSLNKDPAAFQGYSVQKISDIQFPIILRDEELIIDFGDHYTGYLNIELENADDFWIADAPVNFNFDFAEMPIELNEGIEFPEKALSCGWLQKDFKSVRLLPYKGSLERRYSFRYMRIKRSDTVRFAVKITALYIDSVSSVALESVPQLKTGDDLIDKIDYMCLKTLKECEQEVFEDGPKRDQRLWIGDLRLQAQLDYLTFKNTNLIKKCIYLFTDHLTGEGLVPSCVFPDTPPYVDGRCVFLDYSLCLALCLYDYLQNTGDADLPEELYDVVLRQIRYVDRYLKSDRENINGRFFIDHGKYDKTVAVLGYFGYVLHHTVYLAERLGKNTSEIKSMISDTEKNLNEYYSKEKGLFISPTGEISWHSQIWASLSGCVSLETAKSVLTKTAEYDPEIRPSSPFMTHYYLEALYNCGFDGVAKDYIKQYWGAMLKAGFDCCPECFMPENDRYSPYSAPALNSACHAWSCTAAYWIRKYHC